MNKSYLFILLFVVSVFFINCNNQATNNVVLDANANDRLINAILWFNKSPEKRAIYYQTFNLAREIVQKKISEQTDKPFAVITDIDETVLDNSLFEIKLLKENVPFSSDRWTEWEQDTQAKALPGAVEFSHFLKDNNVELFYISNRSVSALNSTMLNLQKEGFAFADSSHILLRSDTKDKTARRALVEKTHNIILYLGDNLRDFDEFFKYSSDTDGWKKVDQHKNLFGDKYIVMPNPMYGQWLNFVSGKSIEDFRKFLIYNY